LLKRTTSGVNLEDSILIKRLFVLFNGMPQTFQLLNKICEDAGFQLRNYRMVLFVMESIINFLNIYLWKLMIFVQKIS
jgi:hypothetical protein